MKLHLLRHAECEKNIVGIPGGPGTGLTTAGVCQARDLARRLKQSKENYRRLSACPTTQTIETGDILSLQLNLPVIVAPELRSINLGVLSGIPIDKARTLYPEDSASMDAWRCGGLEIGELKIRGMEDPIEFYLRGLRYLIDALIREDQGSEIIVCTTSIMILFHNLKLRRTPRIGDGYRAKECKNTEVVQLSFEQDDLSWLKREERLWDTFRR